MSDRIAVTLRVAALLSLLTFLTLQTHARVDENVKAQADALETACEQAREAKLAPERSRYVEECVARGKQRDDCTRFYADHGAATAARSALYLDLPECVEAFEFGRANRIR
jgi:uncharacterized protein YgiB involved in biofilm formation